MLLIFYKLSLNYDKSNKIHSKNYSKKRTSQYKDKNGRRTVIYVGNNTLFLLQNTTQQKEECISYTFKSQSQTYFQNQFIHKSIFLFKIWCGFGE